MRFFSLKTGFTLCLATAVLCHPSEAHAHLVQTGFGTFYDGVAHVLMTPEDMLMVIAVGLLAGLRGQQAARAAVLVLPLSWGCGLLVGQVTTPPLDLTMSSLVSFGVVGGLVALNLNFSRLLVTVLVVLAGLLHGYVGGATLASQGLLLCVMGTLSAVMTLLLLCASLVASLERKWALIAARVAGSWLAAVGLLMCGWLARGGTPSC